MQVVLEVIRSVSYYLVIGISALMIWALRDEPDNFGWLVVFPLLVAVFIGIADYKQDQLFSHDSLAGAVDTLLDFIGDFSEPVIRLISFCLIFVVATFSLVICGFGVVVLSKLLLEDNTQTIMYSLVFLASIAGACLSALLMLKTLLLAYKGTGELTNKIQLLLQRAGFLALALVFFYCAQQLWTLAGKLLNSQSYTSCVFMYLAVAIVGFISAHFFGKVVGYSSVNILKRIFTSDSFLFAKLSAFFALLSDD